jgi:hypothetical protein
MEETVTISKAVRSWHGKETEVPWTLVASERKPLTGVATLETSTR